METKPTVRFRTLYTTAERYLGISELAGEEDHPLIQWWHSLCAGGDLDRADDVPWCSAFVNGMAWELNLPMTRKANARSWVHVGDVIEIADAIPEGNDVVIISRGDPNGWQGHVGVYAGHSAGWIKMIGGNQRNQVSVASFPLDRLLGVRRLM